MTAAENVAFGLEMRGVPRAERDAARRARRWRWSGSRASPARFPRQHVRRPAAARRAGARARDPAADAAARRAALEPRRQAARGDADRAAPDPAHASAPPRSSSRTTRREAMALSDRIVVMNQGRVEQIARADEAYERPASAVRRELPRQDQCPAGTIADGTLSIGDRDWPAPRGIAAGAVTVTSGRRRSASPTHGRSPAPCTTRIFQGNHWLLPGRHQRRPRDS